ncbi:MAG: YraN family protein [Bacteroidia bacterium]|nr:YraN family protein [Bacteroidia bacterium]
MYTKQETGKRGEEIATEYLKDNGYKILAVNWQNKHQEIDIIAEKNNVLIIAEVKSRTAPCLVEPEQAVTLNKQKLLIRAANAYIYINKIDKEVRFDIISIVFSSKDPKLEHIIDAFYPRAR